MTNKEIKKLVSGRAIVLSIGVYFIIIVLFVVFPLYQRARNSDVLIPSWAQTDENPAKTRSYDIVSDPYGYKSLLPGFMAISIIYWLTVLTAVTSSKAKDNKSINNT